MPHCMDPPPCPLPHTPPPNPPAAAVCYHGDVPMEDRKAAIATFSAEDEEFGLGGRPVFVATDLAAR